MCAWQQGRREAAHLPLSLLWDRFHKNGSSATCSVVLMCGYLPWESEGRSEARAVLDEAWKEGRRKKGRGVSEREREREREWDLEEDAANLLQRMKGR